jgi:methyl-accepting chemotaxis protein
MLQNVKIGMKLSIGFGVLIVTILVISTMSFVSLNTIRADLEMILEENFHKVKQANEVIDALNKIALGYATIAITSDPKLRDETHDMVQQTRADNGRFIETELAPQIATSGPERALFASVLESRSKFLVASQKLDKLIDDNDDTVATYMLGEYQPILHAYLAAVDKFVEHLTEEMERIGSEESEFIKQQHTILIVTIAISLFIAIWLATMITRQITVPLSICVGVANSLAHGKTDVHIDIDTTDETGILAKAMSSMVKSIKLLYDDAVLLSEEAIAGKLKTRADARRHEGDFASIIKGFNDTLDAIVNPINDAMSVMKRLSNRDLTSRITGTYNGDLSIFRDDINSAAQNLEDAIIQVDIAVEQISAASSEISSGSQVLAGATSEQASSLEEISSSLTEINSLTGNNASNAKSGLKLADQAVLAVDEGNKAMEQMNTAMESIMKSSIETGKIIKTIDEIAFQTNLLALNAAVEAAHAGDAGKGFAVVAEEVKNLALRSAEAAKNTNVLIEESSHNSEMGSRIVEQVTKSFIEMKDQFNKVKAIVTEISASSDEQANGVNQINSGVSEMNRVTQQNAANAEESASAAEELSSQASELKNMVNTFKLSKKAGTHRTNRPALLTAPEKRSSNNLSKKTKGYEVRPEQVLPLDDYVDDDFVEFR